MCGCLFLNSFFSSYTFSLTVIIATGNQLDGLSFLEACQMKLFYDTGTVYLRWRIKFSLSLPPLRRCELDSRQLKTVADRESEV